jgi:hypothetical protein
MVNVAMLRLLGRALRSHFQLPPQGGTYGGADGQARHCFVTRTFVRDSLPSTKMSDDSEHKHNHVIEKVRTRHRDQRKNNTRPAKDSQVVCL